MFNQTLGLLFVVFAAFFCGLGSFHARYDNELSKQSLKIPPKKFVANRLLEEHYPEPSPRIGLIQKNKIVKTSSFVTPEEPVKDYREIEAEVTAYCPCRHCCGKYADGKTSTGKNAWLRGAAVDPQTISYGSRIYIPGYGTVQADDTGVAMRKAARQGKVLIDVRFVLHQDALNWGRQKLTVRVYDK